MKLTPREPPGHARRKLRELTGEIARLRDEGYTIRAIQQALADARVIVGWGTVQREVARLAGTRSEPNAPVIRRSAPQTTSPAARRQSPQAGAVATMDLDRYFDPNSLNPLFKKKGTR